MKVHESVDEGLGHSSYLVDLGDGTAALVDPPRFTTKHRDLASALGLRVKWTIDTHSHADYVSGSSSLSSPDTTFIAPKASRLLAEHHGVSDGERVQLSAHVEMIVFATPGHTPDHCAYLFDFEGKPLALFTGGSLMVGTVGRTDLCGAELAEELAHQMFNSLRRFDGLDGDLAVYPTHGAGSFCSAPSSSQRTSTIGQERISNELFAIQDEALFVEKLLEGFGTFPEYFGRLPDLNRRGPNRFERPPTLAALDVDDVVVHRATGGVIVDARPIKAFSAGHVPGSISIALRSVFGSWLGWIVHPDARVVFVVDEDQNTEDLVSQCFDIGHEQLVGVLTGGVAAWSQYGHPLDRLPLATPGALVGALIDVRQANEFAGGHVPCAVNRELGTFGANTTAILDIPSIEESITLMCGHGERAMTAASLLAAQGHKHVMVLSGGPDDWSSHTGRALETTS
jgi:hydroxyacylglutathione hydrolase